MAIIRSGATEEMLGHSDISVTHEYTHLVASALQQATRESAADGVPGLGFGGVGQRRHLQ